jgi:hypothetical protein
MALKDIVSKAKAIHVVNLHGTEIKFSELGYDAEQLARERGREYAKKVLPSIKSEKTEEYGALYVFLEMFRKAGEHIDDADFFGMSSDYHQEIVAAVSGVLAEKVHTEGRRMEAELKERLKAKKLE